MRLIFCKPYLQLEFLKTYYDETLVGSPKALSLTNEDRQQQAEALQLEVEAFLVVPNLLWALWSISQSISTKITFGYWVSIELKILLPALNGIFLG